MYGSYGGGVDNQPETPMDNHTDRVESAVADEEIEQERSPRLRGWALRVGVLATATLGVTMLRQRTGQTESALDLAATATSGMPWEYTGVEADSSGDDTTLDDGGGDEEAEEEVPSPEVEKVVDLEADADQDLDNGILVGSRMRDALLGSLIKVGDNPEIIFGHENSNREGQYFWDNAGMDAHSDVFNTTGQYPGMYGYSFQDIVDGKKLTNHVLNAAKQNAVIEFFWEADNPVNLGNARDGTGKPCRALLPGHSANAQWVEWMESIVSGLMELKIGDDHIPIVLRLFHECTESWYWWGSEHCDAETYKQAWNYTRWYFEEYSGLKNIIYVYAPAKVSETEVEAYTNWYPGTDQVDIIGFDRYAYVKAFKDYVLADCEVACAFAEKEGKPCALAETGIADGMENVDNEYWFMTDVLENLWNGTYCRKLSYMLTWSNEQTQRYWVPLPHQRAAPGFIEFAKDTRTMFAGDHRWQKVTNEYNYGFKTPGTSGDLHLETNEDDPRPIDPTVPKWGTNGLSEVDIDSALNRDESSSTEKTTTGLKWRDTREDLDKDWGPYVARR